MQALHARKGTGLFDAIMRNGGKSSPDGGKAIRPEAEEQPFDRWLRKQLHAMYDEVVHEPLDDLVKLIDDDADRARRTATESSDPEDKA
jgi:hypothetical protein